MKYGIILFLDHLLASSPQIRAKSTPIVSGRGMRAIRSADGDNAEDDVLEIENSCPSRCGSLYERVAEVDDRGLNTGEVDG